MAREMTRKQQANLVRTRKQVPQNLVRRNEGAHGDKRAYKRVSKGDLTRQYQ